MVCLLFVSRLNHFVSIGIKRSASTNDCQVIYLPISMKSETAAPLGRPRAFDPGAALDRAMHVFGPRGTKRFTLQSYTGHANQSTNLYAAFGNKEQLFRKVLDRYMGGPLAFFGKALRRQRAMLSEQFSSVPNIRVTATPAGCLVVQGALACGDAAGSVRKEIGPRRSQSCVASPLQRAKREDIFRKT